MSLKLNMAAAIALAMSHSLRGSSHALSASLSGRLLFDDAPSSADKMKRSFTRYERNTLCIRHTSRRSQNVMTLKMQFRGAPKDARVNKRKTFLKKCKKQHHSL